MSNPFIETYSGRQFHLLKPQPDEVCIEDIAHSLAQQCRWTGQCRVFFSVAEHSRNVSFACEPEDALWGLLHDAPEAYLSDLSAPLKHSGLFDNYRRVEAEVMKAVCAHFGLEYREGNLAPVSVEKADHDMLYREAITLMPAKWVPDSEHIVPLFNYGLEPVEAEKDFLLRYDQLRKERGL